VWMVTRIWCGCPSFNFFKVPGTLDFSLSAFHHANLGCEIEFSQLFCERAGSLNCYSEDTLSRGFGVRFDSCQIDCLSLSVVMLAQTTLSYHCETHEPWIRCDVIWSKDTSCSTPLSFITQRKNQFAIGFSRLNGFGFGVDV
jgi:hypothetical protein